jgi:hypothetical protein
MTRRRGRHWLALATLLGPACDKTLSFDHVAEAGGGRPSSAGTAGTGGLVGEAGTGEPWQRAGSAGWEPSPATGGTGFLGNEDCDSFCEAIGQYCHDDEQTCVQCFWDQDCPSGLYCDRALNRCSSCNHDYGCPGDKWCDSGICREPCATEVHPDRDCDTDGQVCDERRNVCISCQEDAHCSGSPDGPRCVDGGARCAECANDSHCDWDTPHCDPLHFRCVECTDSRDCEPPLVCHTEAQVCFDTRLGPFPR